jgi:hypothetical protein
MKKHNVLLLSLFMFLSIFISSCFPLGIGTITCEPLTKTNEKWYQQVQIYDMGALSNQNIEKYHITVNGLWNGFIGNISSPFAFGRLLSSALNGEDYDSDKDFVDAQHAKGVYVPATILTIQGHRTLQLDDFEVFASRSVNGELCPWDIDADSYWMNALNPDFIDWCINHGKKAIDAGADIIVLDEIQGNSLIPLYQWSSQYTGQPAPGFSNLTIEGFRTYLIDHFSDKNLSISFDIHDILSYDLKSRIASTMNLTYDERAQTDSLFIEYDRFLEESNFEAKKHLILSLREYAESCGKDIVISANSYTLGTNQQFGFWPKGLLFADLLDLFTYENTYTAFFDQPIPRFPRSKWLAWERLAAAATDAPAVTLIDTALFGEINERFFPLFGFSNSLGVLCAEACANKGSFVNYYFPLFTRERNWNQVEEIHEFVMNNQEVYTFDMKSYGEVGILYLYGEGMRYHMNTYLGCAQALAESNIPFEVIFDGDDHYINSTLTLTDIEDFSLILVPSFVDVTADQKQVVKQFVENGGVALLFDAEELGYNNVSGEIPYGNGLFYVFDKDYGTLYFEEYTEAYRQQLADCVFTYVPPVVSVNKDGKKLVVTPYIDEEDDRIILHVINYDHIGLFDFIWPASDITIQLLKPSFEVRSVSLSRPGEKSVPLLYEITEDMITIFLPKIQDYGVVHIE